MRTTRTLVRVAVPLGASLVTSCLLATTALAAPPSNGCPPTYEVMEVAPLFAQGYRVPSAVDSPTSGVLSFGNVGNGDGLICAHPSGNQTTSWGGQIYNFWDNSLLT